MRNLKMKLNLPSQDVGMSDFQLYIMREREAYLKSLNDLSHLGSPAGAEDALSISHLKPSFVNGGASLQNSGLNARRPGGTGLANSGYGKQSTSSQGSLHYLSKNLSSSPDMLDGVHH